MNLTTPTIQELSDSIVGQIGTSISQTIPLLPKAFTRVLAKVLAAVFIIVYKYAGFSLLQMFVAYASDQETTVNGKKVTPLIELGRQFGVGDPTEATRAELLITVTVQTQTGSLAAGSQLLFPATGVLYVTKYAVALDAATVQVVIRAESGPDGSDGSGDIGNLQAADVVEFANPLPNVARLAVVASSEVTGADAETTDAYRERVLRRCRAKPQGGAFADYVAWATSVPGISNAYPYAGDPGEVDVYIEATEESSGSEDGIPTAGQISDVEDAIEGTEDGLPTLRPVTAGVNVLAISRREFDVTVNGLDAADAEALTAAQDAIEAALDEWLRTREPFIVGLSVLPRVDRITHAAISGVVDDAASAVGATFTTVELEESATPVVATTLDNGEKAKLGTVTFP